VKAIVTGRVESLIAEESKLAKSLEDIRAYVPITDLCFEKSVSGFHCYFIPSPTGLRPDSYDRTRAFLEGLVSHFTARLGCHHESFVQVSKGRDPEAMRLFSTNAPKWIPETGLGVWPHRPAPRMMTMEDMGDIESGANAPVLLHSVFRITANGNARLDAMTKMTGTGCGLQLVSDVESAVLLRNMKDIFLGFIKDRVFRIFPWYVPLIEKAVLTEPIEQLAVNAMQSVSLYIRESPEDGGILIVSAEPLAEIFSQLGCKQIEHATTPKWKLGE
jgi:hypothetical protein